MKDPVLEEMCIRDRSAVGQMLLPSFLAEMINSGVSAGSNKIIWTFAAIMAAVTIFSCIISSVSYTHLSAADRANAKAALALLDPNRDAAELDKLNRQLKTLW